MAPLSNFKELVNLLTAMCLKESVSMAWIEEEEEEEALFTILAIGLSLIKMHFKSENKKDSIGAL